MRMKNALLSIAGVLALCCFVVNGNLRDAQAMKPVRIRLGTLAPSGSSFHTALVEMRQKWRDLSKGQVRLTIYPDGTQGGEAAV